MQNSSSADIEKSSRYLVDVVNNVTSITSKKKPALNVLTTGSFYMLFHFINLDAGTTVRIQILEAMFNIEAYIMYEMLGCMIVRKTKTK